MEFFLYVLNQSFFDDQCNIKAAEICRFLTNIIGLSKSKFVKLQEDIAKGRTTHWPELEITGCIKNLSPSIWKLSHLTALYLNDNNLMRLPGDISLLTNLRRLDVSNNKLRYDI
jgi:Leucine-rich repeat (LRR) protein